ncbi:maleylacetoacetate isomerase [Caulobacter sp. NIBR1757]|uniref:maleylacetoacetate isomerase n=1 Tax=Caulobacter sp. NIBR1757 TaxID=3016000 RepID=UPI0022F0F3E0|nr:maleylacetoacetate isomerase [Caulobacter sp. NIBR1757]WGM37327.1 Maleylpyruvate isomerase [Caulobacter sp. NIBR1757]
MKLYSAWRASGPYRLRIALALKGLSYDYIPVDLAAGEQRGEAYGAINAQHLVPALDVDGEVMTQTLSILEWLEETHPEPALLPKDPLDRQRVRAMCDIVACDIHPLNNLRVLKALSAMGIAEDGRNSWVARWIDEGFAALEPMIARHGAGYAFGETPTMADCLLVPQIYNANRFGVDLSPYPALVAAGEYALKHPAIAGAHPNLQPDAKV